MKKDENDKLIGTIAEDFKCVPPAAFYFSVNLEQVGTTIIPAGNSDASFMEVSGIGSKIDTEQYKEGGSFDFIHNLPTGIKYENLVLKRGVARADSPFSSWCKKNITRNNNGKIITGRLVVKLLGPENTAMRIWSFLNSYPVKWSVDQLSSKKNELAIETIEICYSRMTRGKAKTYAGKRYYYDEESDA
jgi:phage tail-like protein